MKKKVLTIALAATLLAGSALSVSAAGVKDVISVDYYAGKYSDLKTAFGKNQDAYVAHFLNSGAKEGRNMNPILDVVEYRKANKDLDKAFGDDWDAYINHYFTVGITEGRTGGVLFDLVDYLAKNPDLKERYGTDYVAVARQYVTTGINEKRPGGQVVVEEAEDDNDSAPVVKPTTQPTTEPTAEPTAEPTTEPTAEPDDKTPEEEHKHVHSPNAIPLSHQDPTCTEDGYDEYRCEATFVKDGVTIQCSQTYKEPIKALGHKISGNDNNVYSVHPTCTTSGKVSYTCERCGKHVDDIIAALGHDWKTTTNKKTDVKTVVSTTCDENSTYETGRGYEDTTTTTTTSKVCARCGATEADVVDTKVERKDLPLLVHSVRTFPNVTKKPSCTETGVAFGYCDRCGTGTLDIILPMTEHVLDTVNPCYGDACHVDKDTQKIVAHHDVWSVTYCKTCKIITAADVLVNDEDCVDADNDGSCDVCTLSMNRPPVNADMEYQVGTKYQDVNVQ